MTPQQIVGLAVRLFAIWVWITAFQSFGIARALAEQDRAGTFPLAYVLVGIYGVAGILLWMFPIWIAHRLIPRTSFEDRLRLPARDAVMAACVILGLWVIVVRAIPSLSWYLALAVFWIGNGASLGTMESSRHLELVTGVANLIVGFLLVAKYEAIGRLIFPKHGADSDAP
jgi:uncharacterized membrane protein